MIPKIETSEKTTTEGYEYIADVRLSKICYQQPSATTIAKKTFNATEPYSHRSKLRFRR